MNKSSFYIRKQIIRDSLSKVSCDKLCIELLIDRVLSLEDSLIELQDCYKELLYKFNYSCVHPPF